jgi:hypothetical protein
MHIYNIGYSSYEESDYYQLYHEKKFSKEEFEEMVAKATINVLKDSDEDSYFMLTFQQILYAVVKELIKNFGFKEVEFDAKFEVFGWADIADEKDWEHDRDEQLNLLTKAVTKEFGDSFKRKKEECDRRLGLSRDS